MVPSLGGLGLYTLSLRTLFPTAANLIATLELVLTAIWAYFPLNKLLEGIQLISNLLAFTGMILLGLLREENRTIGYNLISL